MKKLVLKLDLEAEDREEQRRVLKTVAALSGIDAISMDAKGKKLTVVGTVDPVTVVTKLRKKSWQTAIVSVGPAKEPQPKKEEPKDADPKKEEPKKEEAKKEEPSKQQVPKKDGEVKKAEPELAVGTAMQYRPYYQPMPTSAYYHVHHSVEENPTACTIS